jgi:SAM-dependent methyltransferase
VELLRAYGIDCFGIDAHSVETNASYIIHATIDQTDFQNDFFDVITCFHVLEHLSDPLESIKQALSLLKPKGLIIVEVPNLDSLGFSMFKKKWQPLEIPTHLNHFTPDTLQKLFEHTGKTQIVKKEFFSHRISPSALVLSVFSSLAPRKTRGKYNGRYPMPLLGIYFSLQLLAYPFAIIGSLMGRGEIIRMYIRKCN